MKDWLTLLAWTGISRQSASDVYGLRGRGNQDPRERPVCPRWMLRAGKGTQGLTVLSCRKCKGQKVSKEKKRVEFQIEPGTEDGERISLQGEGDEAVSSTHNVRDAGRQLMQHFQPEVGAGDVIFLIRHRHHPTFEHRSGRTGDLSTKVKIRLSEALLGFSRVCFVHLDGRGIRIEVKKGERVIRHGEELAIRGEGMPIRGKGRKGDLYIRFEVEMPGESWASRQDVVGGVSSTSHVPSCPSKLIKVQSTKVELPGPLPDMDPLPETVVTRYLAPPPR